MLAYQVLEKHCKALVKQLSRSLRVQELFIASERYRFADAPIIHLLLLYVLLIKEHPLSEETAHSTVYHHLSQKSSCITTAQRSLR